LNILTSFLRRPLEVFRERFDRSPLESVTGLEHFVQTRSSYISQTALFGYLKTRMGTKFRILFEDDVFSGAIRVSAGKVFASCLSDLTVFAVSNLHVQAGLTVDEAREMARRLYAAGLHKGLEALDPSERPEGCEQRFETRIALEDWAASAHGRTAFGGSERDLIQSAPVSDQFKKLDSEIVGNSIRFRWTDVREQFLKRIDPTAVVEDWRANMQPPEHD